MSSTALQTASPALRNSPRACLPLRQARETAQYIADMVLELRNMAKAEGFGTLQGLLELAYYEAFGVAHKTELPEGEAEYLEELEKDAKKAAR